MDIFSQSDLKEIYVTLSYRSVGPIEPPQPIPQDVKNWAKNVSPLMLYYVPLSQQRLDKQLITAIQRMVANHPWTPKGEDLAQWLQLFLLRETL